MTHAADWWSFCTERASELDKAQTYDSVNWSMMPSGDLARRGIDVTESSSQNFVSMNGDDCAPLTFGTGVGKRTSARASNR
jgi:hypothetical protein